MIYSPHSYGACGDGVTNDAPAIQSAIDACSAAGGGRVVLESGKTYYSSSIILKSNVELHLEQGSVLKAHSDLGAYVHPNEGQQGDGLEHLGTPVLLKPSYAFIFARDADRIAITGTGTIDGNAYAFVRRVSKLYVTGDFYPRPTLVYVEHCNHISFTDVTLCNAPFWTLHPAGCDDVLISRIRILNDLDVANSDGIDPDHSTNVRILGCHITCADDCIVLKTTAGNREYGPTRNVIISGCTLTSTSAALKIGTESVDDFENILVDNCVISRSNRGISIQIRDGGNVRNVSFSNISIETRRFSEEWWGCAEPITITLHNRDQYTTAGHISNVRFSNITCNGENGVFLSGSVGNELRDILLEKINVTVGPRSRWPRGMYDMRPGLIRGQNGEEDHLAEIVKVPSSGFYLQNMLGVTLRDCRVQFEDGDVSDFGHALCAQNCRDLTVENFKGKAARPELEDQLIR